ncbi:MAG: hypothetical protein JST16_09110 [Bdellovibrionales bacterium]|nr:hypothetical protein [Bdellovibrionales bacterium]
MKSAPFRFLVLRVMPWLAVTHFLFALFTAQRERADLTHWNQQSCVWSTARTFTNSDCGMPRKKIFLWATPHLPYGETIACTAAPAVEYAVPATCANPADTWGAPRHPVDIGWDAYSTWYTRAATLYFGAKDSAWPGTWRALHDEKFLSAQPTPEHRSYPWLVSVIYAQLMRLFGGPNPAPLQGVQIFVWIVSVWLYRRTAPSLPRAAWIAFAFAPIAGAFVFRLYADIWLIVALLSLLWCLQRERWIFAAGLAALAVHLKAEGWVQVFALLTSYAYFHRRAPLGGVLLAAFVSALWYRSWTAWIPPSDFYTSLGTRMIDPLTWTQRLPHILGYYADVFFRPLLWGLLWPFLLWTFWIKKRELGWSLLPLLGVLVLIPLAFLRFPDGAYKIVVLTGSNRALWQTLPLAWLLLKECGVS